MSSSSLHQIVHHIASDQFITLVGSKEFLVESSSLDNECNHILAGELLEAELTELVLEKVVSMDRVGLVELQQWNQHHHKGIVFIEHAFKEFPAQALGDGVLEESHGILVVVVGVGIPMFLCFLHTLPSVL